MAVQSTTAPFSDVDLHAWYSTATVGNRGQPKVARRHDFVIPDMSLEAGNQDWYYTARLPDAATAKDRSRYDLKSGLKNKPARLRRPKDLRLFLDKPLPVLPCLRQYYIEATSAAAFTATNFDHITRVPLVLRRDAPTDSSAQGKLDTTAATRIKIAQAKAHLNQNEARDNHSATLDTCLVRPLHIDEAEELERQKATEVFYRTAAEAAPARCHGHLLDEDFGYTDFHVDIGGFPEIWLDDKKKLADHKVKDSTEDVASQWTEAPVDLPKLVLQPKTRKHPATRKAICVFKGPLGSDSIKSIANTSVARASNPGTVINVNKRSAGDSVDAKTNCYAIQDGAGVINVLPTKRIRITEQEASKEVQDVQSLRAISVHSNDDDGSDQESCPNGSPRPKRTGSNAIAYPGQFTSSEVPYLRRKKAGAGHSPGTFEFGTSIHPNNVYTHTNFIPDPDADRLDYTQSMLDRLPIRCMAWEHAMIMWKRAQRVMTRTPSEENLRREIHLECTAARLEGVSVGQYRYFQGHMSAEDYKVANICICWHECYCSKLCTRFADVLCPCSADVRMFADD